MSKVRTRFAPSPTGFLHIGGVRTAIFAWLTAKQNGGEFILRIEDTDQKRRVEGAEEHIVESLAWLGIKPDEPLVRQSDRAKDEVYKKWAEKLINADRAYADPYSAEEVQTFREQAAKDTKPFLYRNHRPDSPPKWDGKTPLRFKSEPKKYITKDEVMGELKTGPEVIDDFILIKSDGYPTYNFAHIVDDLEMGITHVIRGQEFLASLPNYRNLYEALGEKEPAFITVPHILNEQGNKKLSKRDGAQDILDYRALGYLPEAMINFLATLGWNDGTEQEIFTPEELLQKFSLEQIQKGSAHFDERRLAWISGHHIRSKPLEKLYELVKDFWPEATKNYDDNYKKKVLGLVQERMKFFAELPELTQFFFEDLPVNTELMTGHKQLKKLPKEELKQLLEKAEETLKQIDFSAKDLSKRLNKLLEETGQKPVVLFSLIRIATTQSPSSPGLAETLEVLGKETALRRIDQQLKAL
ncbi:MAG: glutamate--tRNA ligase [Candidatus Saccharimonadales bacterium]